MTRLLAALAAASNKFAWTLEEHERREEALEMLPTLLRSEKVHVTEDVLQQLADTYFLCTYAHTQRKHEAKPLILDIFREHLADQGIGNFDLSNTPKRTRKRIAVVTNFFHSRHVLFQVFGKSLTALKTEFECVAVPLEGGIDHYAQEVCFDDVQSVGGQNGYLSAVRAARNMLAGLAPDIILYIDTAMHPLTMFLSTLRLAPRQFVTFGHPAATFSKEIDGFIAPGSLTLREPFAENFLSFPDNDFAIYRPRTVEPEVNPFGERRLIVPTTAHKITYPFLKALKKIQRETDCITHVLGHVKPEEQKALQLKLSFEVPGAVLYPQLMHDSYLALIGSGDAFALTFPFTGFASMQNALVQGVPGAALVPVGAGMEYAQAEFMYRQTGGGALIARDAESFVGNVCSLLKHNLYLKDSLSEANRDWRWSPIYAKESPGIRNVIRGTYE